LEQNSNVGSLFLRFVSYKPGFGEFMGGIQVHHEKLWFAGTNQNWKLAGFEIHEIKESMDDIRKYCTNDFIPGILTLFWRWPFFV